MHRLNVQAGILPSLFWVMCKPEVLYANRGDGIVAISQRDCNMGWQFNRPAGGIRTNLCVEQVVSSSLMSIRRLL